MWYNRPLKKSDSAGAAKRRLLSILAEDRICRGTRQPTPMDYTRVYLGVLRPVTLLEHFDKVGPNRYKSQVIKWREPIPFNYTEK